MNKQKPTLFPLLLSVLFYCLEAPDRPSKGFVFRINRNLRLSENLEDIPDNHRSAFEKWIVRKKTQELRYKMELGKEFSQSWH